jgi:hypothetical protein
MSGDAVLHWARIAAIDAFYNLKETDPHLEQTLNCLDYSLALCLKLLP